MDTHPEELPEEPSVERQDESPFEIRLNTTYGALLFTESPIDLSIAKKLTERLDEIIYKNRNNVDIKIIYHNPAQPLYTASKAKSYTVFKTREPKTLIEALSPDYGLTKYRGKGRAQNGSLELAEDTMLSTPLPSDEINALMSEGAQTALSAEHYDNNETQSSELLSEEDLSNWAFDLLDYDSRFELRYNQHDADIRSNFTLFFAIRLGTEDISIIDDFLAFHLIHNFDNDINKFTRFLDSVCADYKVIIISQDRCEFVKRWKPLSSQTDNPHSVNSVPSPEPLDNGRKKPGAKLKDKIEIPVPPRRGRKDGLTTLTIEGTAHLVKFIQEQKIILARDPYLSNESLSKAIKAVTGFSSKSIYDELNRTKIGNYTAEDRKKIASYLKEIILLINSKL